MMLEHVKIHKSNLDLGNQGSYEISKLIAKCRVSHTIGENIIKPVICTLLNVFDYNIPKNVI